MPIDQQNAQLAQLMQAMQQQQMMQQLQQRMMQRPPPIPQQAPQGSPTGQGQGLGALLGGMGAMGGQRPQGPPTLGVNQPIPMQMPPPPQGEQKDQPIDPLAAMGGGAGPQ